jgi:hypothetical protein
MQVTKTILGIAMTVILAGCMADQETTNNEPDPTYTETAVHLNADGTQTVTYRAVTLSQELRENADRELLATPGGQPGDEATGLGTAAEALWQDTGCAGSSFWLYDHVNRTGNRICFAGTGIADLAAYPVDPHCSGVCSSWYGAMQSYYSGLYEGWFQGLTQEVSCTNATANHCAAFSAYAQHNSLTSCETGTTGRRLNLGKECWSPAVSQSGLGPVGGVGSWFFPGGSVRGEIWSGSTNLGGSTHTADASGNVTIGFGNPNSASSCGESIKFTDLTSGLIATTSLVGACF